MKKFTNLWDEDQQWNEPFYCRLYTMARARRVSPRFDHDFMQFTIWLVWNDEVIAPLSGPHMLQKYLIFLRPLGGLVLRKAFKPRGHSSHTRPPCGTRLIRIHYISFMTSTLHILHGGCVTHTSRIHCTYFIEHMWHIPTDVYITHKSSFTWIHYIYTMLSTQHMHHGGRVMHMWRSICRAISRS